MFRRGWFDAAAEMIGQEGLTPHEMRHTVSAALDQAIRTLQTDYAVRLAIETALLRSKARASEVPPGRFELPPLPPEGSALSPELWGLGNVT